MERHKEERFEEAWSLEVRLAGARGAEIQQWEERSPSGTLRVKGMNEHQVKSEITKRILRNNVKILFTF